MANNPFSGRVPLNRVSDLSKATDSTSYRPGVIHKPEYNCQFRDNETLKRNLGSESLRRYPNGTLDFNYAKDKIIDLIHMVRDGGNLTPYEKSILVMISPIQFGDMMDKKIAHTMTKLSIDERLVLSTLVSQHLNEELNYNAGRGGSIPNRHVTQS